MQNSRNIARRIMASMLVVMVSLCIIAVDSTSASAATKLKVSPSSKTIYEGKRVTLKSNQKVKWSVSSGKSYVKLYSKKSKSVSVKGIKPGTSYVKATAGKKSKKVKIVVKRDYKPTAITIQSNSETVGVGGSCTVSVSSVTPSYAKKDVNYSSEDTSIATVSSMGLVTGVAPGTVKITATSKLNSKVVSEVTVKVVATRKGTVTTTVNLADEEKYPAGKTAKVWIPVPATDDNQKITRVRYKSASATEMKLTTDNVGNKALYVEWDGEVAPADRNVELSFYVSRKAVVASDNLAAMESGSVDTAEYADYLKETSKSGSLTSGIVKETADKIVKDASAETVYDKAHAIYEWEVENLHRDNSVVGCGRGDVVKILTTDKGGKCTDLNSVFVALCRAEGIPAREMFGIRLNDGDITGAQHCRAQFYLPGYGWVETDAADALKTIVGNESSYRGENAEKTDEWAQIKDRYWGSNNENWVQLSMERDIQLNPANDDKNTAADSTCILNADGTLNNFGYPYGEFDGKYIPCYSANDFHYEYSFVADDGNCGCN